ncbi:Nucleosomal histone H3-Lys79 methylase [Entomortierella beljakovae]|nr:Nucleosomal histone H3-Lys79 methylase [Entomortierella beljakovae]
MPSSPIKELTPFKKRRIESTLPTEITYSSPPSPSSLSPDRSNRASSDRGPGDLDHAPHPSTPAETGDLSHVTNLPTNNFIPQRSLEMELFGVAGANAGPKNSAQMIVNTNPKVQKGKLVSTAALKIKKSSKQNIDDDDGDDEKDDEEYGSLGSLNTNNRPLEKKKPSSKSKGHPVKQRSRLIVVINTMKGTVTVSNPPTPLTAKYVQSNGHRSHNPSNETKSPTESQMPSPTISNGLEGRRLSIIHSDQIVGAAIGRYKNHFHMLVEDSDSTIASNPSSTGADTMHVALEYPGKDSREKFTLMKPFLSRSKIESDDKDEYNPIDDLVTTFRIIMDHYFPSDVSKNIFGTANEGLYRNMTKFKNRKDGAQFLKAVEDFNQIMRNQKTAGIVQEHISQYGHKIPYDLVVHILQQVYSRTVASRASKLNQYEAFSNNVYGEILPILTNEFIQRSKLNNTKVFVDLGCGIGNVVLQVALQTGAESYGVEIMDTPAKFAKKQAREFEARCRAYGLDHGSVTMIHGDFLDTPGLPGILARADVVLVNNYAFNSALNQSLLQLFLDLKEGCKIISLKTFVSLDHKINVRNAGSVESILRVKKRPYYTNAVSWTHNGGEYYIATVDRTAVQAFYENGGSLLDDGGRRSSRRR